MAFAGIFAAQGVDVAFHAGIDTAPARTAAFDIVARVLASEGALTAWRNERFAVVVRFGDAPVFLVERAAARYLGIRTFAAHANGLVRGADGALRMWLARRSPTKSIDPGQLDNLVGGGIAAGETPESTLVREAWEEAGIAPQLATRAVRRSELTIERLVPDGLQRETIFTFDLELPVEWTPRNEDGEAFDHRLVDLPHVAWLIGQDRGPDVVTVDASAVILDCLARLQSAPPR